MIDAAISVRTLRKSYADKVVLDGIDLDVAPGTVFSLLGPNGAGKTTTVNILSTLVTPDSGTAAVAGHDLATDADGIRAAIGLTGQFSAIDNRLTAEENLILMAKLHHLPREVGRRRIAALLDTFDLAHVAKKTPATYSGGMQRKLDLAMTLVGDPQVIFLDEPTTGLDPRSRRVMWDIIRGLVANRVTIFLTTQQLEEADRLADRIAVLDNGKLVAQGTPDELKRLVPGGHLRLRFTDPVALRRAADVLSLPSARDDEEALTLRVPTDGTVTSLQAVLDRLTAEAVAVDSLTAHTPDLDDVFLSLTGHRTEREKELVQ
ncbi:MAG TPA: ATP-binding cassette domain-containing protein [Jatrophihabitantaceae bacterium]|jgi:ABC-2 type transport system ATP-binding protein